MFLFRCNPVSCCGELFLLPDEMVGKTWTCPYSGMALRITRGGKPFEESDWLAWTEPKVILQYFRDNRASERKFQLFSEASGLSFWDVPGTMDKMASLEHKKNLCDLVRDLFGTPFRPVPGIEQRVLNWNDATVFKLARSIYEERRFRDLPILADALEDSGCTEPDILDHCRKPGVHARGCWLLDLVLANW
jgi:hypothetical protein